MGLQARRLVKPVIKEVSGVDHPAHAAPGWLVYKAEGDPDPEIAELIKAFGGADPENEGEDDVADAALAQEVADLRTQVATEKAARQASEQATASERAARAAIEKALTAAGGKVPEVDTAVAKAVAAASATAAEEEAFTKAVAGASPELAAYLKGQRDEVRKAREAATVEREARVGREYLDVAKSQYGGVGNPEQVATTLRAIDERLPADQATEVKRLIKAAGAQARFAELGGHGQPVGGGGSFGDLQAKAAELRVADPTLSPETAITKAAELNPELLAAYQVEMRDTARKGG